MASELRQQGYDTYVGGVTAYSTLGYFSDPVLNTFLKSGNLEVARLIFHELAHQVLYVEGDTVFNESFAVTVENEGLRRWLEYTSNAKLESSVTVQQQRKAAFVELVGDYHDKLQEIYGSNLSVSAKRFAKSEVMSDMKRDYLSQQEVLGESPVYKTWFEQDFNNAKMASLGMYTQLLPAFRALLAAEHNDLPRFYRTVADLAGRPFAQRREVLNRIQPVKTLVNSEFTGVK